MLPLLLRLATTFRAVVGAVRRGPTRRRGAAAEAEAAAEETPKE